MMSTGPTASASMLPSTLALVNFGRKGMGRQFLRRAEEIATLSREGPNAT